MNNNKLKHRVLGEIGDLVDDLSSKLAILEALDEDTTCSGSYDLHDQLTTMFNCKRDLDRCLVRSHRVVPDEYRSPA